MVKINLPKELLQKEAFKTLPAKEKEEYITNILIKILQLNPDGVTTSQIKEATGLTYSTLWHHLEILKSTALSRKISRGKIDVYYPLGNLNYLSDYNKDKVVYTFTTVGNSDGSFVCIHEKRENSLGSYTVVRGIALPVELIDDIINTLKKAKEQSKKHTKE